MSTPDPIVVRLVRDYAHPAARVFDAWLDPAMLGHWMFGPDVRAEQIVHLRVDPRVGGTFSFLVRRGDQDVDHVGTYLAIERPHRLAFTWAVVGHGDDDPSRVTIAIAARGDAACTLTLTHEMAPRWTEFADRTQQGWRSMTGALDSALRNPGEYGVRVEPGVVRFDRLLPGPIERVWHFLVDSDARAQWFARGPIEPRVGGRVELFFKHAEFAPAEEVVPDRFADMNANGATMVARVTRWEPPRVLAFTWGDAAEPSEVVFALQPEGERVRLTLTHHRLASRADTVNVSGGWHAHLGVLAARIAGRAPAAFWSLIAPLEAEYDRRVPPD